MNIHGLQKMTLLDFPGHVACTLFLGGCNFRCPYCHNFDLVTGTQPPQMDSDTFFDFLSKRKGLLDGVAITGGEPCLHPDLPELMQRIRNLGYLVKLDTNGTKPEMLAGILKKGLADYIAMDIKNSKEQYGRTAGIADPDLGAIEKSISLLMNGQTDYEFRTTVVAELHTEADIESMARWISGARRYFLQSFTDRESVPYAGLHAPIPETMRHYAEIAAKYVPSVQLRGVD